MTLREEIMNLSESRASYDDAVEVLRAPINRVKKGYKEADGDMAAGINWAMEELFGAHWKEI